MEKTTTLKDKKPVDLDAQDYRYLIFFEPAAQKHVATTLGSYPKIGDVVDYIVKWQVPDRVPAVRVDKTGSGKVHLVDDHHAKLTLLELAMGYSSGYLPHGHNRILRSTARFTYINRDLVIA